MSLYGFRADRSGTLERLTTSTFYHMPTSTTPDGTRVIAFENGRGQGNDIVVVPLRPAAQSELLIQTSFNEVFAEISPDGRDIAYQANESGRIEISVRPFPRVDDGRWQIPKEGGTRAAWARNGRELFSLDPAKSLTAVTVQTSGPTFTSGPPARVVDVKYSSVFPARQYDVAADGRFLMMKDNSTSASLVVEGWFEVLRAKIGTLRP